LRYEQIKNQFFGLDTQYPLADGRITRRIYLDSGASSLMLKPALAAVLDYLPHYANTHTTAHTSARITAQAMDWAHQKVLEFVHADPERYVSIFMGSGTTAPANRLAHGLKALRPDRDIVLVSTLEHHSNDLPHRAYGNQIEHIPLCGTGPQLGNIDVSALESLLQRYTGRVNYIAVTGVSNVTGVINPLTEIAELAHRYDVFLIVDAAQMAAHMPVHIGGMDINSPDFVIFSGHKIYAPGSPGVLIGRRDLLAAMPPFELGGGIVKHVTPYAFELLSDIESREHAGTPNIVGSLLLACALETLDHIGMDEIFRHDLALVNYATRQLQQCPGVRLYGPTDNPNRVGCVAFNLEHIDHGLTAALLNDYYGIAVRNECFCAHPYVAAMIKEELYDAIPDTESEAELNMLINLKRGMVRASFGLYTTEADINALTDAIKDITHKIDHYRPLYEALPDGNYRHLQFTTTDSDSFDLKHCLLQKLT
jgi:selenocysteine lyase/cysteine desulfurase